MGYDLKLTHIDTIEGRGHNDTLTPAQNPEKTGLCHWIASTIKPIYHTQRLVGLGARGKSRASAIIRLLILLSIIGPQPLTEKSGVPIY